MTIPMTTNMATATRRPILTDWAGTRLEAENNVLADCSGGLLDVRDGHQPFFAQADGPGPALAPHLGGQGADDGVELMFRGAGVVQAGDQAFQGAMDAPASL